VGNEPVRRRTKFENAARAEKVARTYLYHKGQIRLLFQGRKILGPVMLLGVTFSVEPETVGAVEDERVWHVALLWKDEERDVGEYDLGSLVDNEMEVLAWVT